MPFPLNQQICTACITVTQLVHSKTALKLAAPIKNIKKVKYTEEVKLVPDLIFLLTLAQLYTY